MLAVLAVTGGLKDVIAADLCTSMLSMFPANAFESAKGAWDSDAEKYRSLVVLEGFSECAISEDYRRFSCRKRIGTRAAALQEQHTISKQISACFGSQSEVVSEETTPDRTARTYTMLGGPDTTFRALSPDRTMAFLSISASGFRRKNGDEDWTVHLSIYNKRGK